jgi:hypothetical protein
LSASSVSRSARRASSPTFAPDRARTRAISARNGRHPDGARSGASAAGLEVVDLRTARLRIEFRDVGAVVWFLRKVIWMVPGFTVEAYRDRLRELHELIESGGPFVAHSTRYLIEARKPRER